jgi:site-specific DNA-methyltransferase (adenine-specific)
MIPTLKIGQAEVYLGNNLDVLPTLPNNSVDSIVCDPPYELGFMGKSWDSSGIAYSAELWKECLRVLKPGGHLLAFSGSRTYHRMVVAIEDAGFEIRDMVSWISNKTFPKSHNISKAIDKKLGAKREVIGINQNVVRLAKIEGGSDFGGFTKANPEITVSATEEAKKWDGWGTALKPTVEPIVLARKPIEETIAQNVLKYGVGGLNIDATRIGTEVRFNAHAGNKDTGFTAADNRSSTAKGLYAGLSDGGSEVSGRWPANVIFDETTAETLEDKRKFFYVARASKEDRNEGLDIINNHPTVKPTALMQYLIRLVTPEDGIVLDPFCGSGSTGKATILEGKKFIGIELTEEYFPIIEGRLKHAIETRSNKSGELFE